MSDVLLAARGLRKSFGGVLAVNGVDLAVRRGDLMCIIGPNGAGKSSLLNLLCGVTRLDAGEIAFEGRNLSRRPVHDFARAGIARKFQAPSIFADFTVRENLCIAGDGVRIRYHSGDIDLVLQQVSLVEEDEEQAGTLPHGKKQWLEIGLCLMTRPKLFLLDEPTAGMTTEETLATVALVRSLADNAAVVVVEHDMSFVRTLDTWTNVMHQGMMVRGGVFNDIENDSFVQEIYFGTD